MASSTAATPNIVQSVMPFVMNQTDDFFRFSSAALIFFSLFGYGLYEAGVSRDVKTLKLAMLKTLLAAVGSMIAFWLFGYALAFGGTNPFGGGQTFWGFSQMSITNYAHFWLQYSYAALSAIIAIGSLAERCHIATYIVFPFIWCGFAYPILAHWVWHPNGWLQIGTPAYNSVSNGTYPYTSFLDASGSGVVLLSGGIAALIGAIIIKPRKNRFDKAGIISYDPHSNSLAMIGGSAMILGLIIFNGTGIEATNYSVNYFPLSNGGNIVNPTFYLPFALVAMAMTNSVIAAAVGAFTIYFMQLATKLPFGMIQIINGTLCALASISCCAGSVQPWAAAIFGIFAALGYLLWSLIIQKARVDDVIDAYAVFAGGAMWGLIAAAFLINFFGIVWAANVFSGYLLAWQLVGICAIWAWAGACALVIFGILFLFKLLRAPEDAVNLTSSDIEAPVAYPLPMPGQTVVTESPYKLQQAPSMTGSMFTTDMNMNLNLNAQSPAHLPRFT